jgi:prepilin-type N-terminal cleavage/methylation domain-containing protein
MTSKTDRCPDAGFSLLEVIVCIGLMVLGTAIALGTLPTLVHRSQDDLVGLAATDVARNAIERFRAGAAYYPTTAGVGDLTQTNGHAWAFAAGFRSTARVAVRVRRALCGTARSTSDVSMDLTTTYDPVADAVRAVVTYPRNACDTSSSETVTLTAPLAPAQWSPQTRLPLPVGDPAQQ